MLKHGLTSTERTGDEACTTLYNRVEGINCTHTGLEQLEWTWFLLVVAHGNTYWPFLNHVELFLLALLVCNHRNSISNLVLSGGNNLFYSPLTLQSKGSHNFQRLMVLLYTTLPCGSAYTVARLCTSYGAVRTDVFAITSLVFVTAVWENGEIVTTDTIVRCSHRRRCENIRRYLEKQVKGE